MAIGDEPKPGQQKPAGTENVPVFHASSDSESTGDSLILRPNMVIETLDAANLANWMESIISIIGENINKPLDPYTIIGKLIDRGFPVGLASEFGREFMELIGETRDTLVIASKKPKLAHSLEGDAKREILEYLLARKEQIARSLTTVGENAPKLFKASVLELTNGGYRNLPPEAINSVLETIQKLNSEIWKLRTAMAEISAKAISEKFGLPARVQVKYGSVGILGGKEAIEVDFGEGKMDYETVELFKDIEKYIKEIFPKYVQLRGPRIYAGDRKGPHSFSFEISTELIGLSVSDVDRTVPKFM